MQNSPDNVKIVSDFDSLAGVLRDCFESLSKRDDERISKLQNALELALKPGPSKTDVETTFWNAYRAVSEEHDIDFRNKYNSDLDTSLIFAGLFSAVASAFIIAVLSDLRPDPNDMTQALLRILVHSSNNSIFSADQLTIPQWNGPPPSIVVVNGMLYSSLFNTLLVALLAVLGKQWLAYYTGVGNKGTSQERGIERQRKFEGFRRWGFEYVMETLPILLQLSLLLFAAAVTEYLWTLHRTIGCIVLALSTIGVLGYAFFAISAAISPDSPFRTPAWKLAGYAWSACIACFDSWSLRSQKTVSLRTPTLPHPVAEMRHRKTPLFADFSESQDSYEPLAVLWILETSTDPDIIAAAGSMAVELQWPPEMDLTAAVTRLRDTFIACFRDSMPLRVREFTMNRAIACGQAYCHLCTKRRAVRPPSLPWDPEVDIPHEFLERMNISKRLASHEGPFETPELNFIGSLIHSKPALKWSHAEKFSDPFFRWALHITPYHFYFSSFKKPYRDLALSIKPWISPLDRVIFTDWLLCIGGCLGVPLHLEDLAVVNKGDFCVLVLEDLLPHLLSSLMRGDVKPEEMKELLATLGRLLRGLDNPLDLRGTLFTETYILDFCRKVPQHEHRPEIVFHVLRLLAGKRYYRLRHELLDPYYQQLPTDVDYTQWLYEALDYVWDELNRSLLAEDPSSRDVAEQWLESFIRPCEDLLQLLIEIPRFGHSKPSVTLIHLLAKCLRGTDAEKKDLHDLAYLVFCIAREDWFDDPDLQPVLQDLDIWTLLGSICETDYRVYGWSYMNMAAVLAKMPEWLPIVQYDIHRWVAIFNDAVGFGRETVEKELVIALGCVASKDWELGQQNETRNLSVETLLTMALSRTWEDLRPSSRDFFTVFVLLARCTISLFHPVPAHTLSLRAADETVLSRLQGSIFHTRDRLLHGLLSDTLRPGTDLEELEMQMEELLEQMESHLRTVSRRVGNFVETLVKANEELMGRIDGFGISVRAAAVMENSTRLLGD